MRTFLTNTLLITTLFTVTGYTNYLVIKQQDDYDKRYYSCMNKIHADFTCQTYAHKDEDTEHNSPLQHENK